MTYPCKQCNMDEGSPVCLQDERCPMRPPGMESAVVVNRIARYPQFVTRADLEDEIDRLRADRDCRTCRHFRGTQHCHSVLRCIDGSSYQRGGTVQLWETAPVVPAPF